MWTCFFDMNSGGSAKIEPYELIFIEGTEDEATVIFLERFGRDPYHVTCDCCGSDYMVSEHYDLAQATAHARNCDYAYFDKDGMEVDSRFRSLQSEEIKSCYVERQSKDSLKGKYVSLDDYMKREDVLFIFAQGV